MFMCYRNIQIELSSCAIRAFRLNYVHVLYEQSDWIMFMCYSNIQIELCACAIRIEFVCE